MDGVSFVGCWVRHCDAIADAMRGSAAATNSWKIIEVGRGIHNDGHEVFRKQPSTAGHLRDPAVCIQVVAHLRRRASQPKTPAAFSNNGVSTAVT